MGLLRERIFGISPAETLFERRGFRPGKAPIQQRMEHIGQTFLMGYHAALRYDNLDLLARHLDAIEQERRGFAFEGAGMGLALVDMFRPGRTSWLKAFMDGAGDAHRYMIHIGAGWLWARLRRKIHHLPRRADPLLGWLALDGYGFHEGYFHPQKYIYQQTPPARVKGYARRVFDQGLGRSLWFVECADIERIPAVVAAFPETRRADLWAGVGLAATYAGGRDDVALEALKTAAGNYLPQLAQGSAFAAKARQRAGNEAEHTHRACRVLCGISSHEAAARTDTALQNLPYDDALPAFEHWRIRIQASFISQAVPTLS